MSVSFNDRIRVGQLGTIITITITSINNNIEVPVDLTDATLVQIDFKRPDNTVTTVNATVLSPPIGGLIRYTDTTGIFTLRGRWQVRGKATFSNGGFFPGSWTGFPVEN